ncbi:MAG: FMN-binding protein [Deltaproteobacteria bacterium]|nr:FMN-binding protein [Deltaproteobacteria bacterium]
MTTPASNEPSSARLVLSLGLAGLVSGLALVGVYLETKPLIEENQAAYLREKVFELLPGTVTIAAHVVRDGELVLFEGEAAELAGQDVVYAGLDENGQVIGNAIPAQGPGFQDTIRLIYGYDPERRVVVGMRVLESKETPGLGDKIAKDPTFLANFTALAVEPEVLAVKAGEGTDSNHVDCITGATISSKAVVDIINGSVEQWLPIFNAEGGS